MYLIDTNILIQAIAGRSPDAGFLETAIKENSVSLSVITISEFLVKASAQEQQVLSKLIRRFPVFDINSEIAHLAASFRRELNKSNRVVLLDCFIAAQAYKHNLTVVTNNVADFPMKNIKVIKPN